MVSVPILESIETFPLQLLLAGSEQSSRVWPGYRLKIILGPFRPIFLSQST